ncbi:MAG: hypothetical protein ABS873_00260, partial [Alkalibacterium sp.]
MSNKNAFKFGLSIAINGFIVSTILTETPLGDLAFIWRLAAAMILAFSLGYFINKMIPVTFDEADSKDDPK